MRAIVVLFVVGLFAAPIYEVSAQTVCPRYVLTNPDAFNGHDLLLNTKQNPFVGLPPGPYFSLVEGPECSIYVNGSFFCNLLMYFDQTRTQQIGTGTIQSSNMRISSEGGTIFVSGSLSLTTNVNTGQRRPPTPSENYKSQDNTQLTAHQSLRSLPSGALVNRIDNNFLSLWATSGTYDAASNTISSPRITAIDLYAEVQCVTGCWPPCGQREVCNLSELRCEPAPPQAVTCSSACSAANTAAYSATSGCISNGVRTHSDGECVTLSFRRSSTCDVARS